MKLFIDKLKYNLQESIRAKEELLRDEKQLENFGRAVSIVADCYKNGGRLYIAGNGGSAADAQHLAAEFISKLARPRDPLPAEALTTDTSILTAIGNDYGYDQVFSRQIQAKLSARDVFLAISTSGQSPNIIRAIDQCKRMKVPTILLTGRNGGKAAEIADVSILVKGNETSQIQESHMVVYHTLCACVEDLILPEEGGKLYGAE